MDKLWGYVVWRCARNWRTIELADGCPPQRRSIPVTHAGNLPQCSRVQRAVIASTQVSRDDAAPRRRNGFPFSNASKLLWLPRERGNSPTSTHTCGVVYLHSVARGGGKPFASPSPGKSSHCTHALLFRTTMTAFPHNGHVLYKDLPTPYQLSENNSRGSFLQ